jgi:hypothetical protein
MSIILTAEGRGITGFFLQGVAAGQQAANIVMPWLLPPNGCAKEYQAQKKAR